MADLAAEEDMVVVAGQDKDNDNNTGSRAVETYCTDVEEDEQGGFVYVHKLRKGVNRQSHALKVAGLAGLPEHAVQVAKKVLMRSGAI